MKVLLDTNVLVRILNRDALPPRRDENPGQAGDRAHCQYGYAMGDCNETDAAAYSGKCSAGH